MGLGQFHWRPETYLDEIRAELPRYDRLQDEVAAATRGVRVRAALELGTGTGETARRVLALHPDAKLLGIDASEPMLAAAGAVLPPHRVELRLLRLEDAPPPGRFDLVFSAFAVHHLQSHEKAALFARIAAAVRPGGRFVLGDVVVPENPADAVTPLEEGFDLPDPVDDQLRWLEKAGLTPRVVWAWKDTAVLRADSGPAGRTDTRAER
jgi:tRNA (cmo5U34)-methyltransferase